MSSKQVIKLGEESIPIFQLSFNLGSLQDLDSCLENADLQQHAATSRSILIQLLVSDTPFSPITHLYERFAAKFPSADIIGVTTAGEIHEGSFTAHRTVVIFSFFARSGLQVCSRACRAGEEAQLGLDLAHELLNAKTDMPIKGLLLYATNRRIDASGLLGGLQGKFGDAPLFGAGAAAYVSDGTLWVFANGETYTEGAVIVAFRGKELEIEVHSYLGWEPLSRSMTITEIAHSTSIKTLDGIPAAEIYEKYLGISDNERFFEHMLEFPIMIDRQGYLLARVPIMRETNGGLRLVADVQAGEQVRLAYGNPKHIVIRIEDIQRKLGKFRPEGILLFSCYCRQIYLQEAVNLETQAFQHFAPSSGMYTYGEFYGQGEHLYLHNATMIAVSMREGQEPQESASPVEESTLLPETKQMEMTSRLARFIGVVVEELEHANLELREMMQTDSLTGLLNRGKMDRLLQQGLEEMEDDDPLAVVMLDVDFFKQINDTYGHLVGDEVLQQTARILRRHTGEQGAAGRWGGEEFLLVLPHVGLNDAVRLAEQIRSDLEQADFGEVGRLTASFGVTAAVLGETTRRILKRADEALYAAKHEGRNRVVAYEG